MWHEFTLTQSVKRTKCELFPIAWTKKLRFKYKGLKTKATQI